MKMGFKGTNYAGQSGAKFGGLYKETKQPSTFGSPKTYSGNMGASAGSTKGAMLGKKWKSTCTSCGGKM
jgi:hypothetical protein